MCRQSVYAILAFCAGCSSTSAYPPVPVWYQTPPSHTATHLFFIGESSAQPDEALAKKQAEQSAIAALGQYCGARVESNSVSKQRETNGQLDTMVSVTVSVAGEELTLREAVVQDTLIRKNRQAGFDGFVLLRWPRAQYERVRRQQSSRAQRALNSYLRAQHAVRANQVPESLRYLSEAKAILSSARTEIPLNHPQLSSTGLLRTAIETLDTQIASLETTRQRSIAVGISCTEKRASVPCPPKRVGAIRAQVTQQGLDVASVNFSDALARKISESSAIRIESSLRTARYLLAVTYDADLLGEEDGFVFARCGARGVLFDTNVNRVVNTTEVRPQKGGHLNFEGAANRGCNTAESELSQWINQVLSGLSGPAGT